MYCVPGYRPDIGGLLDSQALGDLLLAASGQQAQGFQAFDLAMKLGGAR
jgi:hypothetical protein